MNERTTFQESRPACLPARLTCLDRPIFFCFITPITYLCQVIGDVGLIVGQPADGIVTEMRILQCKGSEAFQRGELQKLLETPHSIVGQIHIAQSGSERQTVANLGNPIPAQP